MSEVAWRLFLLAFSWRQPETWAEYRVMQDAAEAVASATDDPREQRLLMAIGDTESHWDPRVADCRRQGDGGASLGLWQVKRAWRGADDVCHDMAAGARAALRALRWSLATCGTTAAYASGTCGHSATSRRYERLAR